jgi:biofilm protein TabA
VILDRLDNWQVHAGVHPLFPQAFAWLASIDTTLADGKYPIGGDNLVAGVNRYRTAPYAEKQWEAHRLFGDIQMVLSGEELCGHGPLSGLDVTRPYQLEKDVEKYAPPAKPERMIRLKPGLFAVFLPEDAHQPGVQTETPADIIKVVVKFRLRV